VPAQLVNFSVVPVAHQFAIIGAVRVGWSAYLLFPQVWVWKKLMAWLVDTYLSLVNARVEQKVVEQQLQSNDTTSKVMGLRTV
jgi:hypothetical protein